MPERTAPLLRQAECFEVRVNGAPLLVDEHTSVAVAILRSGTIAFRRSVLGELRGPLCGMGVCAECQATINGVPGQLSCQHLCQPGMTVQTEERR